MSEDFREEHEGWYRFLVILATFIVWCFCSHCIFMRFCTCLKRPHKLDKMSFISGPDEPFKMLSAHRGGSAEGTENTLFASVWCRNGSRSTEFKVVRQS